MLDDCRFLIRIAHSHKKNRFEMQRHIEEFLHRFDRETSDWTTSDPPRMRIQQYVLHRCSDVNVTPIRLSVFVYAHHYERWGRFQPSWRHGFKSANHVFVVYQQKFPRLRVTCRRSPTSRFDQGDQFFHRKPFIPVFSDASPLRDSFHQKLVFQTKSPHSCFVKLTQQKSYKPFEQS